MSFRIKLERKQFLLPNSQVEEKRSHEALTAASKDAGNKLKRKVMAKLGYTITWSAWGDGSPHGEEGVNVRGT